MRACVRACVCMCVRARACVFERIQYNHSEDPVRRVPGEVKTKTNKEGEKTPKRVL